MLLMMVVKMFLKSSFFQFENTLAPEESKIGQHCQILIYNINSLNQISNLILMCCITQSDEEIADSINILNVQRSTVTTPLNQHKALLS